MADKTEKELAEEYRALLTDFTKGIETKHTDLIATQGKALEAKYAEWALAQEAARKAFEEKSERLIKERTARMPGIISGADQEILSLGQRIIQSEHYKALGEFAQRTNRLSITLPGMVLEKRAITSANYPINPIRVGSFAEPQLPLAIRDLLTVVALGATNAVEYVKETWNLLADYQVAEGDKKAESTGSGTLATAMVRTIAHFAKMSRQMVADAPAFAASLNAQLIYGVLKKEDIELLHGDNTAGHLHGIYVQAPALPAGILTDITNSADRILAAIAHLASLGYRATAIVVGPTAWAQMQILKNTQGAYILGGPPAMTAPPTLWGVPVVPTFAMTGDAFLVGEFAPNATLFDRESVTVDIAYENEDDFVKNMVTVRAEERIALAVFRPNAFVKGVLTVAGP